MRQLCIVVTAMWALAACTSANETNTPQADRTVVIQMRDNHFEPNRVAVRRGETVTFRFMNRGSARHDAFIGDKAAQRKHERAARIADEEAHGGGHEASEADAITVESGKSGRLAYTFDKRGEILIGCHEPGHYAGGMFTTVTVE